LEGQAEKWKRAPAVPSPGGEGQDEGGQQTKPGHPASGRGHQNKLFRHVIKP
jgi:hypothetical protein